jgi:hypothetical protein
MALSPSSSPSVALLYNPLRVRGKLGDANRQAAPGGEFYEDGRLTIFIRSERSQRLLRRLAERAMGQRGLRACG